VQPDLDNSSLYLVLLIDASPARAARSHTQVSP